MIRELAEIKTLLSGSSVQVSGSLVRVHRTTLPHLDIVERALLDELIRQGRAEIVDESIVLEWG